MKKKLVFISNMAAPYQVKFCYSLQKYFDTEFWFYVRREDDRPKWWEIPLGDKCKVMKLSGRLPIIGYFSLGMFIDLIRFNPDIIYLGGFMKWHWIIFKLGKIFGKKVIFMSEPARYVKNDKDKSSVLRTKENSKIMLKIANKLFKGADLYIGMGDVAVKQFIEELEFESSKCTSMRYPQDIEAYYSHNLRKKKDSNDYKILFANRLIDRYQPLFMLDVFKKINEIYPNVELYMNNEGPLKLECMEYIKKNNIKNVRWLDSIDSWNNMHLIYRDADILVLPATYSNGNGTIIEACASGMGIIISDKINHMEKYAKNNSNCFICRLDKDDFVKSIIKYIENPELFNIHGSLSRDLVKERKNENLSRIFYENLASYKII